MSGYEFDHPWASVDIFFLSCSLTSRAAGGSTVDLDTIQASLCGTWMRAAMYRSHSSLRKVVCPMFGYKFRCLA